MKTVTLLKNAESILMQMKSVTCADFTTYDNMIDFDALNKTLESVSETLKEYKTNSVKANAKIKYLPL